MSETLKINSEIGYENVKEIKRLYEFVYEKAKETSKKKSNFEKLQKILDDLIERKVIRPSTSPYASPIVLTLKKSGEIRLCIDFRAINKITIKDNFPCQLIEDNLDRLRDKYFFYISRFERWLSSHKNR